MSARWGASWNEPYASGFDVSGDALAGFVVADVVQEIDATTQAAQPDGDIERAAADMTMSMSVSPITSPRVMV